jgi:hypothetical protein
MNSENSRIIADLLANGNAAAGLVDFASAPGGSGGVVFIGEHEQFFTINQQSNSGGWQSSRLYRSRIEAEFAAALLADFCGAENETGPR